MPHGYTYQCEKCDSQWDRSQLKVSIGPASMAPSSKFKCYLCLFELDVISEIDGVAWATWKTAHSEMLHGSPAINRIASQIDQILDGKRYTPKQIKLTDVRCHFCNSTMAVKPDPDHPAQCPNCQSCSTKVVGEFADCITYVDPSDHQRWWKSSSTLRLDG